MTGNVAPYHVVAANVRDAYDTFRLYDDQQFITRINRLDAALIGYTNNDLWVDEDTHLPEPQQMSSQSSELVGCKELKASPILSWFCTDQV